MIKRMCACVWVYIFLFSFPLLCPHKHTRIHTHGQRNWTAFRFYQLKLDPLERPMITYRKLAPEKMGSTNKQTGTKNRRLEPTELKWIIDVYRKKELSVSLSQCISFLPPLNQTPSPPSCHGFRKCVVLENGILNVIKFQAALIYLSPVGK